MSNQSIIEYCAPTLAGLKTGSLFLVKNEPYEEINSDIRALNRVLKEKGLRAIPVRKKSGSTLIYVYRLNFLEKDLRQPEAEEILLERGYTCSDPCRCVARLAKRLACGDEFPHEIGLFLGYPAGDVKGFIDHPNEGVKCVGCWKVYSDKDKAEQTFRKYKKCTEKYKEAYKNGQTLSQLAVAAV